MKGATTSLKKKGGFTLVEVLTSMAVLAVMLVIWANMFRMATSTWSEGRKKSDLNGKARLIFDMIGRDFKAGIFRPDLPAFVDDTGEFDYTFYTKRESEDGGERKVSVVRYKVDTNTWFYRQSVGLDWERGWHEMPFMTNVIPAMTNREFTLLMSKNRVMSGIARMEMAFVASPSTTFSDPGAFGYFADKYYTGCKNIVVTIAIMDDMTVDVLGSKLSDFTSSGSRKLPQMDQTQANSNNVIYYNGSGEAETNSMSLFEETHKPYWESIINQSGYYEQYPRQLRTGLKVFERYYNISLQTDY